MLRRLRPQSGIISPILPEHRKECSHVRFYARPPSVVAHRSSFGCPRSWEPAPSSGTARRGGVLRISVDQAAAKLNPLLTRVNPEYLLAELLYSGLTRLGTDMTPEADLAASWAPPRTSPNGPSSYARTSSFTTARPALRPTSWRASR